MGMNTTCCCNLVTLEDKCTKYYYDKHDNGGTETEYLFLFFIKYFFLPILQKKVENPCFSIF